MHTLAKEDEVKGEEEVRNWRVSELHPVFHDNGELSEILYGSVGPHSGRRENVITKPLGLTLLTILYSIQYSLSKHVVGLARLL